MPQTKGIRTADLIHETAAELFYRQGYEATTLRQVAAGVGIQVGSLYNHISGKDGLLFNIMVGIMDDLIAALRASTDGLSDPTEALRIAIDCHIRFHANRARDVFIGNSELRSLSKEDLRVVVAKRDEYELMFHQLVRRVADEGDADVIDVRLQTYAILALGTHVSAWYTPKGPLSLDLIVSAYTEFIFRQMASRRK